MFLWMIYRCVYNKLTYWTNMAANSISFDMSNMNEAYAPTNALACTQNPVIEHSNTNAYSQNSHIIQLPPLGNTSDIMVFNDQPKPNMRNTMISCVEHVDLHVSNDCSHDPRSHNESAKNFMVAPTLPHITNMEGSNMANKVPLNNLIPNPSSIKEEKLKPSHLEGPPPQRKSTFFQATLNCVSMLLGISIEAFFFFRMPNLKFVKHMHVTFFCIINISNNSCVCSN